VLPTVLWRNCITNCEGVLELKCCGEIVTSRGIGGISKFVVQNIPTNKMKLKLSNCIL